MKLAPLDAQAEWDWLRAGIQCVIDKTGMKYRPEDVYVRLRNNTAWAFMIGERRGFIVFTQEHDHDGMALFVWILWAAPGALAAGKGELYAELERVARECKAKRIRMQSPREGWEREAFFDRVAVVYEHEVKHG